MTDVLPPSPNWYFSNVVSVSSEEKLVVYAGRSDVICLKLETGDQNELGISKSASFKFLGIGSRLHKEKISSVHIIRNVLETGVQLGTTSDDGKIKVHQFTPPNGKTPKSKMFTLISEFQSCSQIKEKLTCGELVADGEQIVAGSEKGNIIQWNWRTGLHNVAVLMRSPVFCMRRKNGESILAIGLKCGAIFLYNTQTHNVLEKLKGHDEEVHSLCWSKMIENSDDLMSTSRDRTVRIWDTQTTRCKSLYKIPGMSSNRSAKDRYWFSATWLQSGHIIAALANGELQVMKPDEEKIAWRSLLSTSGHHRLVFTITDYTPNYIITTSMDRSLLVCKIMSPESNGVEKTELDTDPPIRLDNGTKSGLTGQIVNPLKTLGGFVYCIRANPIAPERLAVGVGDHLIRIWNNNSESGSSSVTALWQGIQNKVTSVAWHPANESMLAYGTEDGRVGMFPSLHRKPPVISASYHKHTVYVVIWAPAPLTDNKTFCIYSVGDGTVCIHHPSSMISEQSVDLNELLVKHESDIKRTRSEISFTTDYQYLLLGNGDGTVLVLSRLTLKCLCTVKITNKLVNALRVQPPNTDRQLLAIGSNENLIKLVDFTSLTHPAVDNDVSGGLVITDSVMTLKGHKHRVTDLGWSIFDTKLLLSVSFDEKSVIWNTVTGEQVSVYQSQRGHLLSCQWSLADPDLVYTGSDNFSLHAWKMSENYKQTEPTNSETKLNSSAISTGEVHSGDNLQSLIETKKRELMKETDAMREQNHKPSTTESDQPKPTTSEVFTAKSTRKRTTRSFFPNLSANLTSGDKDMELNELLYMVQSKHDETTLVKPGKEHLGLFSLNQEDFTSFIDKELEVLQDSGNIENSCYMLLWRGDVTQALELAHRNRCLNETLVNAASTISYSEWQKYCRLYARQLKQDGNIQKSVVYLLYTHDTSTAIDWLTEHHLYREAISVAHSRLPPDSAKITQLYQDWIVQLRKDGNFDTLLRCLMMNGDEKSVLDILHRNSDLVSLSRAIQFALSSKQCHAEIPVLCDRLTRESLLSKNYQIAEQVFQPHKILQAYYCWCYVHKSISDLLLNGEVSADINVPLHEYIDELLQTAQLSYSSGFNTQSSSQKYTNINQVVVDVCRKLMIVNAEEMSLKYLHRTQTQVLYSLLSARENMFSRESVLKSANNITLICGTSTADVDYSNLHFDLNLLLLWRDLILIINNQITNPIQSPAAEPGVDQITQLFERLNSDSVTIQDLDELSAVNSETLPNVQLDEKFFDNIQSFVVGIDIKEKLLMHLRLISTLIYKQPITHIGHTETYQPRTADQIVSNQQIQNINSSTENQPATDLQTVVIKPQPGKELMSDALAGNHSSESVQTENQPIDNMNESS